MAVDYRRDRTMARHGVIDDRLGMLGVTAGVEHDEPLGRIKNYGVAIRSIVERHSAGDEVVRLGGQR